MMADVQAITQAIIQVVIKATKIAVHAMAMARAETHTIPGSKAASMGPKIGSPILKELMFDWNTMGKYTELGNYRLEVKTIFET